MSSILRDDLIGLSYDDAASRAALFSWALANLRPGRVLVVHLFDGEIVSISTMTVLRFLTQHNHDGAMREADLDIRYIGVTHEDGACLIALDEWERCR